ncbi:unnamed protein product [Absidia cylindrospora]
MSSGKYDNKRRKHSRSAKAGLLFPVARLHRYLRQGHYASRIADDASVYLASVLEYLTAEILELSGTTAHDNKKKRITPRHLQLAIRNDEELDELLRTATISEGGVLPHIHGNLLYAKRKTTSDSSEL